MALPTDPMKDPILAMAPEVGGYKVLPPCVLYSVLGGGGMGRVYLGKHMGLLVPKAVKVLHLLQAPDDGSAFVERFRREAQIGDILTHENLVKVNTIDAVGDLHYLVMEYVAGEDCGARLRRRGPLSEAEALNLLLFAARGMGYAHDHQIVHRDLKPANLMVSARGEVKVTDLGLARIRDMTHAMSHPGSTMGTPMFMAPEQFKSSKVGPEADVWSLGATLYCLLAGQPHLPRDAGYEDFRHFAETSCLPDIRVARPEVAAATAALIQRCTAVSAAARFADGNGLAEAIEALVPGDRSLLADPAAGVRRAQSEPSDATITAIRSQLHTPARLPAEPTHVLPGATASVPERGPEPVATTAPRRAGVWRALLVAVLLIAVAGAGAFWVLRPPDPEDLLRRASAAGDGHRFGDAVALLTELEAMRGRGMEARTRQHACYQRWVAELGQTDPGAACVTATAWRRVTERMVDADEHQDQRRAEVDRELDRWREALRGQLRTQCQLTEPDPQATYPTATVPVRGRAPVAGVQVLVDGRATTPASDGSFQGQARVPAAGVLRVVFRHEGAGVEEPRDVPVRVKAVAASVQLRAEREATSRPSVRLLGSVQDGPARVVLVSQPPGGAAQNLDLGEQAGPFERDVELPAEGEQRFEAVAEDAAGRKSSSTPVRVKVDRTAPRLKLEPLPARTRESTLALTGVLDEDGWVEVEGRPLRVEARARVAFELKVPLALPAQPRSDVTDAFRVRAVDAVGNAGAWLPCQVVFDAVPPQIAVQSPTSGTVVGAGALLIQGTVSEPGCSVSLAGGEPTPCVEQRFRLTWTPVAGPDGFAVVQVSAADGVGRTAEPVSVRVQVDGTGPELDEATIAAGRLVVRAHDASPPLQLALDGGPPQPMPDGRFDGPLPAGDGDLALVVLDRHGNRTPRRVPRPRAAAVSAPPVAKGTDTKVPGWAEPLGPERLDGYPVRVQVRGQPDLVLRLVREGGQRFYLGETEVSWTQWRRYLQGHTVAPPALYTFQPDGKADLQWKLEPRASWDDPMPVLWPRQAAADNLPVIQVSAPQAEAFCAAYGLRLPTTREFQVALDQVLGPGRKQLRAGENDRANIADLRLRTLLKDRVVDFYGKVEDGCEFLAPVGTFPKSAPELCKDVVGNVAEWCRDPDATTARYEALGGCWAMQSRFRDAGPFDWRSGYDAVGFRVAASIE